jgi:hypothetical protein
MPPVAGPGTGQGQLPPFTPNVGAISNPPPPSGRSASGFNRFDRSRRSTAGRDLSPAQSDRFAYRGRSGSTGHADAAQRNGQSAFRVDSRCSWAALSIGRTTSAYRRAT